MTRHENWKVFPLLEGKPVCKKVLVLDNVVHFASFSLLDKTSTGLQNLVRSMVKVYFRLYRYLLNYDKRYFNRHIVN